MYARLDAWLIYICVCVCVCVCVLDSYYIMVEMVTVFPVYYGLHGARVNDKDMGK